MKADSVKVEMFESISSPVDQYLEKVLAECERLAKKDDPHPSNTDNEMEG
jgi:hypothetical protein